MTATHEKTHQHMPTPGASASESQNIEYHETARDVIILSGYRPDSLQAVS